MTPGLSVIGKALVLAIALWAPGLATAASAQSADPLPSQLALLDADAGLILSVRLSELEQLHQLAVRAFPQEKTTLDLAALGAIALFGFHLLQTSAWADSGFDVDSRALLQLAAIDRSQAQAADKRSALALWRTRLVLKARDAPLARKALSRMRLRERVALDEARDDKLIELLGLRSGEETRVRRMLQRAGVVMLARPAPLDGLVIVSQRRDLFILDLIAPYGPEGTQLRWDDHGPIVLRAIRRRPNALKLDMPGAIALSEYALALWLRPRFVGDALAAAELDGLSKSAKSRAAPRCAGFRELTARTSFEGLSVGASTSESKAQVGIRWHLPAGHELSGLLKTGEAPLYQSADALFGAVLHLTELSGFRGRPRPPIMLAWDSLWRESRACGRGSKLLTIASAWPELIGLFLDEISALHPKANDFVASLGPMMASVHKDGKKLRVLSEAWLRSPGDAIASDWLEALFGGRREEGSVIEWGTGRITPYAIGQELGSIIGAGFRPGSRSAALAATERGTQASEVFVLTAQPAALIKRFPELPSPGVWPLWRRASGRFTLEETSLRFDLELDQI